MNSCGRWLSEKRNWSLSLDWVEPSRTRSVETSDAGSCRHLSNPYGRPTVNVTFSSLPDTAHDTTTLLPKRTASLIPSDLKQYNRLKKQRRLIIR